MIERTASYVEKRLTDEKTGHDWQHVFRVWRISRYLQSREGGNAVLVELSALLHSVTEENFIKTADPKFRSLAMQGALDIVEIEGELKEKIIELSNEIRFVGNSTQKPKSIEGKILQDANWLDGLGAVGVARVFSAGGYLGRKIFDPRAKFSDNLSEEEFLKHKMKGTSLSYFYEKSLKTAMLLNTETAKKLAKKRVNFLRDYLDELSFELELRDIE